MKNLMLFALLSFVLVSVTACEDEIDHQEVTAIQYDFGGSSGPCGPRNMMTVYADGMVRTSMEEAYPPEGETECGEPILGQEFISASEVEALIELVCDDYNEDHSCSNECVGGWGVISFFDGENELAATDNLVCAQTMQSSRDALKEVWFDLVGSFGH